MFTEFRLLLSATLLLLKQKNVCVKVSEYCGRQGQTAQSQNFSSNSFPSNMDVWRCRNRIDKFTNPKKIASLLFSHGNHTVIWVSDSKESNNIILIIPYRTKVLWQVTAMESTIGLEYIKFLFLIPYFLTALTYILYILLIYRDILYHCCTIERILFL